MTLIQSLALSIVQGVSEFLPISSSGHLNLFQHFFGLTPSLSFDIFLNTATLLSVLVFFRHQLKFFFSNLPQIIVGSVPAGLVGVLFKDQVEIIFSNISLLPLFFLITATFVYLTQSFKDNSYTQISYRQALIIGLFQMLAILPGVSRAGSTIFAGLLVGLSPASAFNYSFSLFIPASVGALILASKDISNFTFDVGLILSFLVTFVVGYLSLRTLQNLLIKSKLWYFAFYLLALASILPFCL